jgi:hypothetical protein
MGIAGISAAQDGIDVVGHPLVEIAFAPSVKLLLGIGSGPSKSLGDVGPGRS